MPSTDSGAGTVPIRNGAFVSCLNYNLPRVGPIPTNSSLADNFDLKDQIMALETPNAYLQIVEVNVAKPQEMLSKCIWTTLLPLSPEQMVLF